MKRKYATIDALLKAAQRKLGGYRVTYDGTPNLALDHRNEYGLVVTEYLNAQQAAERADLDMTTELWATLNGYTA